MALLLLTVAIGQAATAAASVGHKHTAALNAARLVTSAQAMPQSLQEATSKAANLQLLTPTPNSASSHATYHHTGLSSSSSSSSSSRTLHAQQQQQQQQQQPSLPDVLLARGYKGLAPAVLRNWRSLADKLNTPGSNVTVVAFGGSITAGYIDDAPNSSWVDPLLASLKSAYPAANISVVNLARGGHDVQAAATCWYQLAPQEADLILVEYSVNGCNQNHKCHSFMSPRVAAYETFLRRIIRTAPGAALLAVAAFDFELFDVSMPDSQGQPTGISVTRPKAYFDSGENFHTRVAHRYGVPVASVRDALYDIFADDQVLLKATGMTRAQLLSPKRMIHPTTAGHILFANVIWYTLQLTLGTVVAAESGTAGSPQQQQQQQQQQLLLLPTPISPIAAAEAEVEPFCAEGARLQQYATNSSSWSWSHLLISEPCPHPNCMATGFSASQIGSTLELTIDTLNSTRGAAGHRRSLLGIFQLARTAYYVSRMGVAQLSCVRGCSCSPVMMDGKALVEGSNRYWGSLGISITEVTPHPQCVVAVTIMGSAANSTGQDFFFNGLAVVPITQSNLNRIDQRSKRAFRFE